MYEIKYRDQSEFISTNVMWMNEFPQEWKFASVKHFYKFSTGGTPSSGREEYYDDNGHKWVTISDLKGKNIVDTKTKITLKGINSCSMKLNKKGSLLYSFKLSVGQVAFLEDDMYTNEAIATFNKSDKYCLGYLYYSAPLFIIENANENIYGAKLLNQDLIKNAKTLFPNVDEQQKIANFLDIKTTQFDSIIAKKEQLIKKLEEAKKSLISEVITGKVKIVDGELVPRDASEMKESGVEWLGMIPKNWDIKRVKDLFNLRNERNSKKMDEVQVLTLYTAIGVRKQEDVESRTGNKVRTVQDYKIVYPNDVVVNIILAWMGAIGYSNDKGVISPAYDIYQPQSGVNSKFYNYMFRTPKFSGECFKYGRGIMLMRWRTYSDEFRSIYVCQPQETEQNLISSYIDTKINDIDNVVKQNKSQIEKLKEAKQTLISEAVTGKIDLRDWEIIEEGEMQ